MIVGPDGTALRPVAGATTPASGVRLETGGDCTRASSSTIPPRVDPRAAPVVSRVFLATSLPRHHLKVHIQSTDTSTTAEEACETGAAGGQYTRSVRWSLGSSSRHSEHMAVLFSTECAEYLVQLAQMLAQHDNAVCMRDY